MSGLGKELCSGGLGRTLIETGAIARGGITPIGGNIGAPDPIDRSRIPEAAVVTGGRGCSAFFSVNKEPK